jgi:hypothetical protein
MNTILATAKKYKFLFMGVKIGSIGKKQKYTIITQGNTFDEAKLKLYETHEHIYILKVNGKEIDKNYSFSQFI